MRILIVDDDTYNRDILKTQLTASGFEVEEASNGEDGEKAALAGNFDLLILDVMMPKKDGWQVCKVLKTDSRTKDTPVIILTARIRPIDELRGWECGADEYVTKPIDYAALLDIVKKLTKVNMTHGS